MHRTSPRHGVAATMCAAAAVATIVTLMPGAADAASASAPASASSSADARARLERACLRIPNIEIRTARLIERLQGGADVRGSLAWLQAQIDRATARGREDLVEVLTNRLAVRQQTLEVLQQRQGTLPELRQFCIDRGVTI